LKLLQSSNTKWFFSYFYHAIYYSIIMYKICMCS
jgi:hypothetical protein